MVLSLEGRHPQAARAWVHAVQPASITLALDRPLRAGLLQQGKVCPRTLTSNVLSIIPLGSMTAQTLAQPHIQHLSGSPCVLAPGHGL